MVFLPASPATAELPTCSAGAPGHWLRERDQAAGGLGGARIGLVDLNRHADVAADRCVGWAGRSRVGWVRGQ